MSPARRTLLPFVAALAGCAAVGVTGCVAKPPELPTGGRTVEKLGQSTVKLLERNDADSIAAAAVLLCIDARDTAITLSARAAARAPDRADLAWLQSRICASTPKCDSSSAESALRAIDPDNGAGWFGALERATQANDVEGIDATLAEMAKRERFDIYVNPIISHLAPAFANARVKALPDAVTFIVGHGWSILIPTFRILNDPCKGDALARAERLQACRALAASLSRGDALITRTIGTGMTLRTWPPDSDEAKAAVERRRVSHYLTSTLGEIDTRRKWNERKAKDYVQILAANSSEEASARAQIVAAGRNPEPPADWMDTRP